MCSRSWWGEGAVQALPTLGAGLWPRWPSRLALGDREPVWLAAHIPVPWESQAHPTAAASPGASVLTASSGQGQPWCPPSMGGFFWDFWANSLTPDPVGTLAGHLFQTHMHGGGAQVCACERVCVCMRASVRRQLQCCGLPRPGCEVVLLPRKITLSVFCPETSGSEGVSGESLPVGPLRWEGLGTSRHGQGAQLCLGQSSPQWGQLVSSANPPACGKARGQDKSMSSVTERHRVGSWSLGSHGLPPGHGVRAIHTVVGQHEAQPCTVCAWVGGKKHGCPGDLGTHDGLCGRLSAGVSLITRTKSPQMGEGCLAEGDTPRRGGDFDKRLFTRTGAVARLSSQALLSPGVRGKGARGCLDPEGRCLISLSSDGHLPPGLYWEIE